MRRIGTVIRYFREQRGLNQSELAQRASVQQSYLSRLENESRTRVDVIALDRIAKALDVTLDEILILSGIRPTKDPENEVRWRQMQRLFNRLPEDRQRELVAIARTLLQISESLKPRIIGRPAPQATEEEESYREEEG